MNRFRLLRCRNCELCKEIVLDLRFFLFLWLLNSKLCEEIIITISILRFFFLFRNIYCELSKAIVHSNSGSRNTSLSGSSCFLLSSFTGSSLSFFGFSSCSCSLFTCSFFFLSSLECCFSFSSGSLSCCNFLFFFSWILCDLCGSISERNYTFVNKTFLGSEPFLFNEPIHFLFI